MEIKRKIPNVTKFGNILHGNIYRASTDNEAFLFMKLSNDSDLTHNAVNIKNGTTCFHSKLMSVYLVSGYFTEVIHL